MHDAKKNTDMIYQMLVPGGGPLEMDGIEEVVMKMGDRPAMKMSGMMLGMMRKQLGKNMAFKDACTEVSWSAQEKVSVPAGSFSAKHFHSAKYEMRHVGQPQGPVLHGQVGGQVATSWCWSRSGTAPKSRSRRRHRR